MKTALVLPYALTLASLFATQARAQIVVQDGDNLKAIVSAAASGSVIEIQSNGTFVGSIKWAGKDLVIRAAAGFTPTLGGAVNVQHSPSGTRATLEGLRLTGGIGGSDVLDGTLDIRVVDCELRGLTFVGGQGNSRTSLSMLRSSMRSSLVVLAADNAITRVDVGQSTYERRLIATTSGAGRMELEMHRSRVGLGIDAQSTSSTSLQLRVESCVIANPGASTPGIRTFGNVAARLVNDTITGFGIGLDGNGTTTAENLLVFGNSASDLGAAVSAPQVANSLIEDGTFAGQNGNFGGTPLVAPNFSLLPGSLGIDAGNDNALGIGKRDFYGAPRIQDGDGNGTSTVDVGAVEL
ncbi:MAG: hypothetical protein K8S98_18745 [Planctomycetes bacterium]|nr:hypothetical protein [Planctomycetota bacterium]